MPSTTALVITAAGLPRHRTHTSTPPQVFAPLILVALGTGWMAVTTSAIVAGPLGPAALALMAVLGLAAFLRARHRATAARWAHYESAYLPAVRPALRTLHRPAARAAVFSRLGLPAAATALLDIHPTDRGATVRLYGPTPEHLAVVRGVLAAHLSVPAAVVRPGPRGVIELDLITH
ncbi:hypothetical protein [Nocardia sp. CC201C]|uniref:hypothetical protein n=1 Tax=Nocardia sp. CC201C TaxID=3044575 RepID=UPI0024A8D2B3|nr:hypothetical protein [Nocardia sp. CC201C]